MTRWGRRALVAALVAGSMAGAVSRPDARELPSQLRCRVAGGFGFFVAGRRAVTCTYYRPDDRVEFYLGSSDKLGVDLGPTNAIKLDFTVAGAPLDAPGALAGRFVGAQAGVTLGFGASSEALVGGATGTVALVPFTPSSLTKPDDTGLNVSAGLGMLELRYAGSERRALHERY